jgi:hypothetical protein
VTARSCRVLLEDIVLEFTSVSSDVVGSSLGDLRQGLRAALLPRRVSMVLLVGVRSVVVDAQWWSATGGAARGGEFC